MFSFRTQIQTSMAWAEEGYIFGFVSFYSFLKSHSSLYSSLLSPSVFVVVAFVSLRRFCNPVHLLHTCRGFFQQRSPYQWSELDRRALTLQQVMSVAFCCFRLQKRKTGARNLVSWLDIHYISDSSEDMCVKSTPSPGAQTLYFIGERKK